MEGIYIYIYKYMYQYIYIYIYIIPAGVYAHVQHSHNTRCCDSFLQGSKVHTGWGQLEAPHNGIWFGQRNSSAPSPHRLLEHQELENR